MTHAHEWWGWGASEVSHSKAGKSHLSAVSEVIHLILEHLPYTYVNDRQL
jgi:hypothetical protein